MKLNATFFQALIAVFFFNSKLSAQCGTNAAGGSSSNMFTQIRNATNPVAADKNLNTVVFIHRNNAGNFGGNSGQLRYDVSVNGGSTWTNDQGVLNPLISSYARYPNVVIHNPTNNINPANAYLGYMAATINSVSSAWNGVVTGVRQLSGAGNTENYNQPILSPQLIPHSVLKGAPGVYWGVDAYFNGTVITGFAIYKGLWNPSNNDIQWSTNFSVTPGFVSNTSISDYNIAFDPSGTYGWFSFLSRLSPGPANSSYYPVFYKTTNGGQTWTGPYQVDLGQFTCITTNINLPNVASTNFEHDLVVDVYGNPHMLTTVCSGNNAYAVVYGAWHHMFDITQVNGVWAAYDIANVQAGRGTFGTSPNTASMDMAPQAARSADGTKLFFTWSDNLTYALGASNLNPNLFGKAFNVVNNTWTGIKDFSSCNVATNGKIFFPHVAPEVLEPSVNLYKVAAVYAEFTAGTDPALTANFRFLDNITFSSSEFTVANPSSVVNIVPAGPLLLCPNSSITIGISGNYGEVLWSNGSTAGTLSIGTSTNTIYTVAAQVGCYVGLDTIAVSNMSISSAVSNSSICQYDTTYLTVSGNAFTYTWNPGAVSSTVAGVSPTVNTVYTVSAAGSNNCIFTQTLAVTVFSLPVLSIAGQDSVCKGSSLSLTVSGASTYSWSHGAVGNISTTTPTANTTYTVYGADVNLCKNTQTITISVVNLPTVNVVSSRSVICRGESCTLTVIGANSYSWSSLGSSSTQVVVSPSTTSTYSVTGTNTFGCVSTALFTQSVALCTGLNETGQIHSQILIWPNPNQGDFALMSGSDAVFGLYDQLGQMILHVELNSSNAHKVQISQLPVGVYYLVPEMYMETKALKIIVNR
ncbi:MAG TPA: hypothetical protein PLQ93_02175 [Bacteroidia bacterium]|nr:hypothetical protein [Bacteroidia bacterium]